MKKLFIILIAIIITTQYSLAQKSLSEIARQVKPSVVTIIAIGKDKTSVQAGTGFFVSPMPYRDKLPSETTASFARRIREKSDAYYDRKDVELVGGVLGKYPEYRANVKFTSLIDETAPKLVVRGTYTLSSSFVVTNWHVVKDAKSIRLKRTMDRYSMLPRSWLTRNRVILFCSEYRTQTVDTIRWNCPKFTRNKEIA